MVEDLLATNLRRAWRAALLRHEAERAAGRETESVRTVAERLLTLLNDKSVEGPDAVADMELRATIAATIMSEVEALERDGH